MSMAYYHKDPHFEKRRNLVEGLKRKGITDLRVLEAISMLPREKFVNPSLINKAYDDHALPIECEQTISQPYTVAYMTSVLNVKKDDRVLEIGTGSGYQACLLHLLGAKVFTIERIQGLFIKAKKLFNEFDYSITTRFGDGTLGWKEMAPFDGIIVTAGAPSVPELLKSQLKIGGKLVIPIGDMSHQVMNIIQREDEDQYRIFKTDNFKFVPLIGKEGWAES